MPQNKFFPHGLNTPWKIMLQSLDNAGVPGAIKSLTAGPVAEAAAIKAASGIDHTIIYRITKPGIPTAPNDVPDYSLPPRDAAAKSALHYQQTLNQSQELNDIFHLFHLECGNELRTQPDLNKPNWNNLHPVDWLGQWALAFCQEMTAWRPEIQIIMFGMNAGTPEMVDWLQPGMKDFISFMADSAGKYGISFHEGVSFGNPDTPIWENSQDLHYITGRFQNFLMTCDLLLEPYPNIYITEWAYRESGNLPNLDKVRADIHWLNENIYFDPAVKSVHIWDWSNNNQPLSGDVTRLIPWLTEYSIATYEPEPAPVPIKDKVIIVKGPQNMTLDEYLEMAAAGFMGDGESAKMTTTLAHTDMLKMMEDGRPDSYVWIAYPDRQPEVIEILESNGYNWKPMVGFEDPEDDPLAGWVAGPLFHVPHMITSHMDEPRDYDGDGAYTDLHEGIDVDVIGGPADSKEPVRAADNGVVYYRALSQGLYFNYVIIVHNYNGLIFYTWYAHLDAVYVNVGDVVSRGTPIGELGGTGGTWPEHVHWNVTVPGYGMRSYEVDWVVNGEKYLTTKIPPLPPVTTIDLLPYFVPNPSGAGPIYEMRRNDGSQERAQMQVVNGRLYLTKGAGGLQPLSSEWEEFIINDPDYIGRRTDTSPGSGRYYIQRDAGRDWARWCPRRMYVGQRWIGQQHLVQFYAKNTCAPVDVPWNGPAANDVTLFAHYDQFTTPYGLVINDVVVLGSTEGEVQLFAKGIGWVGWVASWGTAYLSEIHGPGQRPDNTRESGCFSN